MYKLAKFFCSISTFALLFGIIPQKSIVSARGETLQADQGCFNLDVVFIVDQSRTMSGQNASDPLDQRKYAVDAMIDLLTGLSLDSCPGTHHRISVISYGSTARVDLWMRSIHPTTVEEANELRDENGIKRLVVADQMGDSNPKSAFTEALQLWHSSADLNDDGRITKKIIVFLTGSLPDGYSAQEVYKDVNSRFEFDSALLGFENCMLDYRDRNQSEELAQDIRKACIRLYPITDDTYNGSTYIWTVFLLSQRYEQDKQAYSSMIEQYDKMSREHGGRVLQIRNDTWQDVLPILRLILSTLSWADLTQSTCGAFAVNPYEPQVRLVYYKIDPDIKVSLSYVDIAGRTHTIVDGKSDTDNAFDVDYYAYGTNESYSFSYPYPGIWHIAPNDCRGFDPYFEHIDAFEYKNLNIPEVIPQYEIEPFYDPEHPQYLAYEAYDSQGNFIPQADHPRFAINIAATVTSPTGRAEDYTLTWDEAGQSFRSQKPLLVPEAGIYDIHITGTTYTHEGSPHVTSEDVNTVFNKLTTLFDFNQQFEVLPVIPFTIEVVDPPADATIKNVHALTFDRWAPLDVAPLPIHVRLLDRDGNMIPNPEEYLAAVQDVFTARAEGEGQVSDTVKLQPDPNNPGYFTGEIPNFAVVGGKQKVVVVMDANAMLKERRPYNREVQSDFVRVDDLFHTSGFWNFLLLILSVGIPAYLALPLLYSRMNNQIQKDLLLIEIVSEYSTIGDLVYFPVQLPWSPEELKLNPKALRMVVDELLHVSSAAKAILEEPNLATRYVHLLDAQHFSESLYEIITGKLDRKRKNLWLPIAMQWENILKRERENLEKQIEAEKSIKRKLKVFLCHAHTDRDAVRTLYARLTKDGVDAWLDKEKLLPGQDWELEIRKMVREADVVVVCLSKQFNEDGFRQKEVKLALDVAMEKREDAIFIIPARLEECDTLESLRKWHWVDLFDENGYEKLIRALHARADKIGATLFSS